jgi:tRNA-dihydrouridine synthase B
VPPFGAGYAVSEMVTSRARAVDSAEDLAPRQPRRRAGPIAVQIAGTEAAMMAEAAVYNIERGAQIIDINMGCPAKKVCNKWAGSALMQDEAARAGDRAGRRRRLRAAWRAGHAEDAHRLEPAEPQCGGAGAPLRGRRRADAGRARRTREQGYGGEAEYETVAAVKAAVRIPVVANGDIRSPEQAREVLAITGADALMVGRAAQGRPWIFREIAHFLASGSHAGAAAGRRSAAAVARPPAGPLHAVRRIHRRAQRAQAHRLVRARPAGRRGIPRAHEPGRQCEEQLRRRRRLLRRAGAESDPIPAARAR